MKATKSTSVSHTEGKDINFYIKCNFMEKLPSLQPVAPKLQFSVPRLE